MEKRLFIFSTNNYKKTIMKKKLLTKMMLLLCALVAGSESVWADDYYVKVTAAGDINTNSTYIIVAEGANVALGTWSSGKSIPPVSVTISSSTITVASNADNKPQEIVLEEVTVSNTKYHVIKHANEAKYLQGASSATDLKAADSYNTDASKWTIGINSNEARMFNKKQTSNAIIFRRGDTYNYFKNFNSSNVNNTEYFYGVLYKKVVASFGAEKTMISYSCINGALDFTDAKRPSGLKAYQVTAANATSVTLEEVTSTVAKNTGLILTGTAETTYNIPVVASGTDISGTNLLVATDGTSTVSDAAVLSGGAFHPLSEAGVIAAGKAYLPYANITGGDPFAGGAPALSIVFGGSETTDVNEKVILKGEKFATAPIYNLAGQRVAQPKKGLYIVNGKKVVIK